MNDIAMCPSLPLDRDPVGVARCKALPYILADSAGSVAFVGVRPAHRMPR